MQDLKKQTRVKNSWKIPDIPDKLYFTIGEVAKLCDLKTHVLRYWEQEFEALKPVKRKGNRRYYQQSDVMLVCKIKKLLYDDGFTIEGAKAQMIHSNSQIKVESYKNNQQNSQLESLISELEALLETIGA